MAVKYACIERKKFDCVESCTLYSSSLEVCFITQLEKSLFQPSLECDFFHEYKKASWKSKVCTFVPTDFATSYKNLI